ncbi:ADP-ribosylglycohydrolase [Raineyella antarctica]|uniref:ADP-ribosylglycohydrolase n=1 Tax=Raineyella antarctica TaxID=1577474 RepID=A0A1G6I4G6_9ACTN|nr:ADP-ribosylglycohydrolase family protein [Raineyella antarctica]SDC01437.1 ADP-ribosylglycohydrolase [Raineyella antarctica]
MDDGAAGDDAVGREAMDAEQRAAEAAVRYAVRLMSRVLGSFTGFVVGEGWGSQWRDGEWHPGVRSQLLAYTTTGLITFGWQRDHGLPSSPADTVRQALERWGSDRGDLAERQIPGWLHEEAVIHGRTPVPVETIEALRSGLPSSEDSTLAVLRAIPVGVLGAAGFPFVREMAMAVAALTHTGPRTLATAALAAQLYGAALEASARDDGVGLVEVLTDVLDSRPLGDPLRWRLEHLLRQDPRSLRFAAQRPAPEGPDDVLFAALTALLAFPGGGQDSWLGAIRSVVECREPVGVRCLVGALHGALHCPGYTPDLEPGVPEDVRLWEEAFVVFGDLASDLVHSILATPGGHSEDDERADEWCRRYPA